MCWHLPPAGACQPALLTKMPENELEGRGSSCTKVSGMATGCALGLWGSVRRPGRHGGRGGLGSRHPSRALEGSGPTPAAPARPAGALSHRAPPRPLLCVMRRLEQGLPAAPQGLLPAVHPPARTLGSRSWTQLNGCCLLKLTNGHLEFMSEMEVAQNDPCRTRSDPNALPRRGGGCACCLGRAGPSCPETLAPQGAPAAHHWVLGFPLL